MRFVLSFSFLEVRGGRRANGFGVIGWKSHSTRSKKSYGFHGSRFVSKDDGRRHLDFGTSL